MSRSLADIAAAVEAVPAAKLRLVARDACPVYQFEPTASVPALDPFTYDVVIVAFSGGKDSLALLLLLLLLGVPRERIELWHHDVDGREGSSLMDWPCTRDYCAKVAAAFGVRLYCSWKVGGFEREMLKEEAPTAGYLFETPDGLDTAGGKSTRLGTRRMFPQKHHSLTVRWCSAYTKTIDRHLTVVQMADAGQPFEGMRAEDMRAALSPTFDEPVFLDSWTLPRGAHGDACGPT